MKVMFLSNPTVSPDLSFGSAALKKKSPQDRQLWWHALGKAGSGLTNSTTTQAQQTQGFELPHPNIFPSRSCWNVWRGRPYGSMAAGSLWLRATANYLKVSMWVQYWCCSFRSQRLSTSLMTHCNQHSQVKLFGLIWCVTHQSFQSHYNGRLCDGDAGETRSGMVWSQNAAAETRVSHCGAGEGGVNEMGFLFVRFVFLFLFFSDV